MSASVRLTSPVPRGVHRLRMQFCGRNAYLATTSDGTVLHDMIFVASEESPDAVIVSRLRRELNDADPVKPRHLQLVRSVQVVGAIDGPSPAHPEIQAARDVGQEIRELLAQLARERAEGPPPATPSAPVADPNSEYSSEALIARLSAQLEASA